MKNIKKAILITVLSVLSCLFLMICPGFIRKYSVIHAFWISYLAYFFTTLFFLRKFPGHKKIIIVSFIATLIGVFIFLCYGSGLHNFALPIVSGFICASFFAYLFNAGNSFQQKAVVILFFCGIGVFYIFWGYPCWTNYVCFGNFTQKTNEQIPSSWPYYMNTATGQELTASSNKDKLFLFDFYNTRCGVCFKKFPILQKTYDKYKDNHNISIFAVNIPWQGDSPGLALQKINERKYTFPVLLGKNKSDSIFGVQVYPTIILFRNDTIFFKGDIENVTGVIEKELRNK